MFKLLNFFILNLILINLFFINDLKSNNNTTIKVLTLVNSEPITNVDLENRVNFILFATGFQKDKTNNNEIYRDAMYSLVVEKLKFQLAKKIIPEVISQAEKAANDLISQNFSKDDITAKAFLRNQNISYSTIYEKYLSDILWSNILRNKFRKQFLDIDILAQRELERLKKDKGSTQVKLSEIILLPNSKRNIDETLDLSTKIFDALKNGASFENIAQQYSASSSSANGGNLDWILLNSLPNELKFPIQNSSSGNIIKPIVANDQVYIIRKEAVRAKGLLDPKASIISLARAVLPINKELTSGELLSYAAKLQKKAEILKNCNDIKELNKELGSNAISFLDNIQLGSLSIELQNELLDLKVFDLTKPMNYDDGVVIFMLCSRKTPELNLPSFEKLRNVEIGKLLSSLGTRYLNRIEKSAVIEYKNKEYLN